MKILNKYPGNLERAGFVSLEWRIKKRIGNLYLSFMKQGFRFSENKVEILIERNEEGK